MGSTQEHGGFEKSRGEKQKRKVSERKNCDRPPERRKEERAAETVDLII